MWLFKYNKLFLVDRQNDIRPSNFDIYASWANICGNFSYN
jgi:hypothetical protein